MLLCVTVGMVLASPTGLVPLELLLITNLGVALVAGSAACVNHIVDAQADAIMARTAQRPIAEGRIAIGHGIIFSGVIGVFGISLLALLVNPLTAWLNLASWFGYGIIYSLYLKRATPQNIVIGGLFGAAPPLFGWTAVTNQIEAGGVLLVLIIFVWTPPHFWALALDRKDEYRKVDIPMLPIVHGDLITKQYILSYTLALLAISLVPWFIGMTTVLYAIVAGFLGLSFVVCALRLLLGEPNAAIQTFKFSIVYLMALFVVFLLDHYFAIVAY